MLVFYVATVPIAQWVEYILEESDALEKDGFSFSVVTRIYILAATIVCVIYLQSFARSFVNILPFVPFKQQLITVMMLQGMFNIIGAIIRFTGAEIGDYSEFESYQLLFICIFSCVFAFFTILHICFLNPSEMARNSKDSKKTLYISSHSNGKFINSDSTAAHENPQRNSQNPAGRESVVGLSQAINNIHTQQE